MFDISLFEKTSTARLEQWGVREGDAVCVRINNGRSEVRLSPRQWDAILDRYRESVDESSRRLRWAMILSIPFSIALLILVFSIPPLRAAMYWLDENLNFLGFLLILAIMSGLPITAIILHASTILKALDRGRRELRKFERSPARHRPPPRQATPLERVAAFTVLPYLLIEIYGTIDPDAYRNTPWTGTRLDFGGLVCVAVILGLGYQRWRAVRLARASEPPEKTARTVDVLARTRNTPS